MIIYPFAPSGKKAELNRFVSASFALSRIVLLLISVEILERFQYNYMIIFIFLLIEFFMIRNYLIGKYYDFKNKVKNIEVLKESINHMLKKTYYVDNTFRFFGMPKKEAIIYKEIELSTIELLKNNKRTYVIYGVGITGENFYNMLCNLNIKIRCFSDGNFTKWGTSYLGMEVISPQQLKELMDNDDNISVLIASGSVIPIYRMLKEIGINRIKRYDIFA
jgi:FlaA1/EpsC-like NDP-sugar epimerase